MPKRIILLSVITIAVSLLVGSLTLVVLADSHPIEEANVEIVQQVNSDVIGEGFGWIARRLDDLNADGVDDYLISAPFLAPTFTGRAFIYSGIDGSKVYTHTGPTTRYAMGYDANDAGDVDQDGVNDYIVGAPLASRAFVYSGVNHQAILTPTGNGFDWFGSGVVGAGDVNGDAVPDLFVGSRFFSASPVLTQTGRAQMLSGVDGSELWATTGEGPFEQFGSSVNVLSDLDNDGVNEVIVSARAFNNGNGKVYVYSGASGSLLDTFEPTAPLSNSGTFGAFFLAGQHDVNADGVGDIYIGDYNAISSTGRAYVYSGATLDPTVAQPPLHQLQGSTFGEQLGVGRFVPDANDDGFDDLIVASWQSSDVVTAGGKIEIYSGADGSLLHSATGAIANDGFGVDALYMGDLNNDGLTEYLGTSVGLDFAGADVGKAYLFQFQSEPSAVVLSAAGSDSADSTTTFLIIIAFCIVAEACLWLLLKRELNKKT